MYSEDYLKRELDNISSSFREEVTGYLIGGLAMIYHGAKNATKDIDIVFENESEAMTFKENLLRNGFETVNIVSSEYEKMKTFSIVEKEGTFRFDIFIRCVCDSLILSEGMMKRATRVSLSGPFNLFVISLEDIFLFKSITNRRDDLRDMSIIASAGLDWEIIDSELRGQPDQWRWYTIFFQNMLALEEEYSILSPLKSRFRKEAEISVAMYVIILKLENKPHTYDELLGIIGTKDEPFFIEVINHLKEKNIIFMKNDIYFLTESIH